MKIGSAFPSSYLKADDLNGHRVTVVIDSVEMESLGEDQRPVAYFQGKQKGLVLNKTNSNMITEIAGTDETDDWHGVKIVLYSTKTDFQGKRVPCIRVDYAPQAASNGRPAGPRDDVPPPTDDDEPMPF